MPDAPADALDPELTDELRAEVGAEVPLPNHGAPVPPVPLRVDASSDDELLVLARAGDTTHKEQVYPPGVRPGSKWAPPTREGDGRELVLLSTKRREPVAKIPSPAARAVARRTMGARH